MEFPPRVMALVRYRLSAAADERVVFGSQLLDPVRAREAGLVDELAEDAAVVARARLETLAHLPRATYTAAKAARHLHRRQGRAPPERSP